MNTLPRASTGQSSDTSKYQTQRRQKDTSIYHTAQTESTGGLGVRLLFRGSSESTGGLGVRLLFQLFAPGFSLLSHTGASGGESGAGEDKCGCCKGAGAHGLGEVCDVTSSAFRRLAHVCRMHSPCLPHYPVLSQSVSIRRGILQNIRLYSSRPLRAFTAEHALAHACDLLTLHPRPDPTAFRVPWSESAVYILRPAPVLERVLDGIHARRTDCGGKRSQRRRGGRSEHRARGAGRGAQDAGRQPGARAQHSAAAEQPGASAGRRADGARRRASPCSPCPAAGLLPVVQGPRCAWPAGLSGCESPAVSSVNFASSALPACAGSGFFRPDQGRGARGRADCPRAAGRLPACGLALSEGQHACSQCCVLQDAASEQKTKRPFTFPHEQY